MYRLIHTVANEWELLFQKKWSFRKLHRSYEIETILFLWTVDTLENAFWCIIVGQKFVFCGMGKHGHHIEIFKMLGSLKLVTRIMYRENVNEVNRSNEEKDRTDSIRTWGLYVLNAHKYIDIEWICELKLNIIPWCRTDA